MGVTSEQKMRMALIAAYMAGNQHGHNCTVEGYWSEAEDVAEEYADEALSQREAQEPVGYVDSHVVSMLRAGTGYSSTIRSLRACEHERPNLDSMTALYTAAPSRGVPEEWLEVMQGLVECARDELVRCDGMKCREPNCISCNDEQEAFRSIERSRELTFRARALLASKGGV